MKRNQLALAFVLGALALASGYGLARIGRPEGAPGSQRQMQPLVTTSAKRPAPALPQDLFVSGDGDSAVDRARRLLKFASTANGSQLRALSQALEKRAQLYHDMTAYFILSAIAAEQTSGSPERRLAMHSGLAKHDIKKRIELLGEWAKSDPEAAFHYALADPAKAVVHEMLQKILYEGSRVDPALAYRLLGLIEDKDLRHRVQSDSSGSMALAAIARLHPERWAEFAQAYPGSKNWIQSVAFGAWASKDPAAALTALEEIWPPDRDVVDAFLSGWLNHSPEAAAKWAAENRIEPSEYAIAEWAKKDPRAALDHIGTFEPGTRRREALGAATASWALEAPEDAIAWINEHLKDGERTVALKEILNRTSGANKVPPDWMKALAIDLSDHPNIVGRREVGRMLRVWNDPAAAREWVMSELPAGTQRLYIGAMLPEWIREDSAAVVTYLNQLPTARARALVIDLAIEAQWDVVVKEWAVENLDAETRALVETPQPDSAMKLLWPIALLALFAAGWIAGHGGAKESLAEEEVRAGEPPSDESLNGSGNPDGVDFAVAKDIDDILARYGERRTRLAASLDLVEWVEQCDDASIGRALDLAGSDSDEGLIGLRFFLLTCWAERSPEAALQWCSRLEDDDEDLVWEARAVVYLAWHSVDPEGATASVENREEGEGRDGLVELLKSYTAAKKTTRTLLEAIEQKLPVEIYVQKALLSGTQPGDLLREAIAAELAEGDLEDLVDQVFRRAGGLGKVKLREMWALLETEEMRKVAAKAIPWGKLQPLEAVHFGIELGVPQGQSRYRDALRFQPEETIAWLASLPSQVQRDKILEQIYAGASSNADRASWLDLFVALPPEQRPSWRLFALHSVAPARETPRRTLKWLRDFDQKSIAEEARIQLGSVAENVGWALGGQDMDELLREIDTFPQGAIRDHLIAGAVVKLGPENFGRAIELVSGLEGDLSRRMQTELLQDIFVQNGSDAGFAGMEAIDDPDQRLALARGLVEQGERIPPQTRAALIDQFFPEMEDPLSLARGVNEAWMVSDPAAAAAWALRHADSKSFPEMVGRLGEQWRYQDSRATAEFVFGLEPGEARDQGLQPVAAQMREVDPHRALEWSLTFSDPERRFNQVLASLKSIDALAATADEADQALRALDISDEERARLAQALHGR